MKQIPSTVPLLAPVAKELEWTLRPQRIALSVVTTLLFVFGGSTGGFIPGLDFTIAVGFVATVNLVENASALRGFDLLRRVPRSAGIQIAVDLILALAAIMVVDAQASPLAWMLLLVPVVDAADRYGRRGALVSWLMISLMYAVIVLALRPEESTSRELVQTGLQQSAAVIAVAISVTAITARVRSHLEATEAARLRAEAKKQELWIVGRAARQMGLVEQSEDVFAVAVDAARSLGFDRADLSELLDGEWKLMSSAGFPLAAPPNEDRLIDQALAQASESSVGVSTSAVIDHQDLHDLGYEQAAAFVAGAGVDHLIALRGYRQAADLDDSSAREAMEALIAQTDVAFRNVRSRAALVDWAAQLDHRANHDELTGLPNRAHLLASLTSSLAASTAVMFLDLDGFKQVNDTLGHDAGDQVLSAVADRLRSLLGERDLAARLGGDEFVIASDGRNTDELETLARAVIEEILAPIDVGGDKVMVGTSIGIATPIDNDVTNLLHRADTAMYEAKIEGRRLGRPIYKFANDDRAVASVAN